MSRIGQPTGKTHIKVTAEAIAAEVTCLRVESLSAIHVAEHRLAVLDSLCCLSLESRVFVGQ